jgi:hypothetical protein
MFVTGDSMKASVQISTKLTLQCLPPDNILDESGLLKIIRDGQSHVLATGSPGKGLLLEANCRPFVRSGPGTYLNRKLDRSIGL